MSAPVRYSIEKHGTSRFFAVRDRARSGELIVVAVYRKGAEELVRRLNEGKPRPEVDRLDEA